MIELRREVINSFSEIGDVLIIGGLVRDLAFYGADERPLSDIDFVITGNTKKLSDLAADLKAVPNRFGGFGLKKNGYNIDFWSMHSTWAKVNRHARIARPKDLVKSTFFDWDAIIYDVRSKNVYALPHYINRLHSRTLEINLEETPSIHGNLVRALRRLVMWDAKPGRKLRTFIADNLTAADWNSIVDAEKIAFSVTYLSQFQSAIEFQRKVISFRANHVTGIDKRRQMTFNF